MKQEYNIILNDSLTELTKTNFLNLNYKSFNNSTNYENSSFFYNLILLIVTNVTESSQFIFEYLGLVLFNLKVNCIESTFEFKIFGFLSTLLITFLIAIVIGWKIFGKSIDYFYKHQGFYKINF
jgi:hypothetical protein